MTPRAELWFDGPNYTADAIIIDPLQQKILLIERRDCGEWALPGGFVDGDEPAYAASIREAKEEASIELSDGQLVYRGIVDDPRNTERAWIETSAYLFECTDVAAEAGDDAHDARWFAFDALPPLYASHASIVARALDAYRSARELAVAGERSHVVVDGGHMNYIKQLIVGSARTIFTKAYEGDEASNEHVALLRKEAALMSHLRTNEYAYLPRASHLLDDRTLAMEAFAPEAGWYWRAPHTQLDRYVEDCFEVFWALERQPLPADVHGINSSFAVHQQEGWGAMAPSALDTLKPLVAQLRPDSQATAARLFDHFAPLQSAARSLPLPREFVLCHHDARQANIAWHPGAGARLVDWSWADIGRPGSDATTLLIDLHKHGHDVRHHAHTINPEHCLTMIGFWLEHASWPITERASSVRVQQLLSALAAYELLEMNS